MKILYIVPNINNEGGVARVLSVKVNFLIENFDYQVHILTQNGGNNPLFFSFNKNVFFHDMILKANKIKFFLNYKYELKKYCNEIEPDVIVVSDNGFKGYFVPLLLNVKIPLVFECHGSKFLEIAERRSSFLSNMKIKFLLFCKKIAASKFTRFVVLSKESSKEWKLKNSIVVSNPLVLKINIKAKLESKKVIAIARHSYEKGLDRLLVIWQKVSLKYPDWILEIYGSENKEVALKELASTLKITDSVHFYEPIINIEEIYQEASILVMTSRTEGFGMVLIEAMSFGLPVIAYDCPVGPDSVITNNVDGYLIENGNVEEFVKKLSTLMGNYNLRKQLGQNGQESVLRFDIDTIMNQWKSLFEELKK